MSGRSIGTEQLPPPPIFDAELGQIFIRMRGITGLGVWDMARRVGTDPTVIANLEAGALDALPDWPDVVAIVEAYAAMAEIDSQPIIARMLQGYSRNAMPVTAPITQHLPHIDITPPPVTPVAAEDDVREIIPYDVAEARRRATTVQPVTVTSATVSPVVRGGAQRAAKAATENELSEEVATSRPRLFLVLAILVPIGFLAAMLLAARIWPKSLYVIAAPMPSVVQTVAYNGIDHLVALMAPKRDGLTWIDVGDPRLRRRDRIQDWGR